MIPDLEVCRAVAVGNGLPLQFVIKEFHIFEILSQVSAETAGRQDFVFKGGTALNKVYLSGLQRFSEDLDFDLQAGSMKEVSDFCRQLAGAIRGYGVAEFRRVRSTVQFYCEYSNPLGGRDHVRLDVASKRILASNPLRRLPAKSDYAGLSVSGFFVYSLEDLAARKLNALLERGEGKDFYDVYSALPKCGKMGSAVERMLESEEKEADFEKFVRSAVSKVEKADSKRLRNLTNPLIPVNLRPKDWRTLKEELVLLALTQKTVDGSLKR